MKPPPSAFIAGLMSCSLLCEAFVDMARVKRPSYRCIWPTAASMATEIQSRERHVDVSGLQDWYHKCGIKKQDIMVHVDTSPAGLGLGLLATSSLKVGEQIALVPFRCCLSVETIRSGDLGKALQGFTPALSDASLIAVQLLYELAQGSKSRHATWLRSFPERGQGGFDHPLFWSLEEIEVLALSSTRNLKDTLLTGAEADYRHIRDEILSKGKIPNMDAEQFSFERFKWALAIVLSRSFYADDALRLAPLLDMANYEAARANEPESTGLGMFGGKGLTVLADREYKKGEEVLISYGPKSGIEYLEDHGFVPDTLENMCELSFEISEDRDPFFADKEDILEMQGLPTKQSFDLTTAGDVDLQMVQFLRLYNLKDKDAFLLEAVFRREIWGHLQLPISPSNELAVDDQILQACEAALANFVRAESMAAELTHSGKARQDRLKSLERIRAGERKALEAAQAWAQRDQMTGEDKQYYQERRLDELQLSGPLRDDEMRGPGGRSSRDLDW